MRSTPILALAALTLFPGAAMAQRRGDGLALTAAESQMQALSDQRVLDLLPDQSVGFRVVPAAGGAKAIRFTTGHLRAGHLYHAVALVIPRDGGQPHRAEGTISVEVPLLGVGALADGSYEIRMELSDLASGSRRTGSNRVVLH